MILSPGAKLNLGLYITGKRADGFHDLVTLFYPIPFSDSLEIIRTPEISQAAPPLPGENIIAFKDKTAPERFKEQFKTPVSVYSDDSGNNESPIVTYSTSGIPIQGAVQDNLCIRAYRMLKADYPALPSINMHLHKAVPLGAGLGGGSADGTAMLKALNQIADLGLSDMELMNYAARLGSDCPIFITNGPQIATGRGEILHPAPAGLEKVLKGYTMVLVCPMIHVPTGAAFSKITPKPGPSPKELAALLLEGPKAWKDHLVNDFEVSVFSRFPEIKQIKETLYRLGATYASMTGSGSAVFGLFANEAAALKKEGEDQLEPSNESLLSPLQEQSLEPNQKQTLEKAREVFYPYLVKSWNC